jgi:hypothetical protein
MPVPRELPHNLPGIGAEGGPLAASRASRGVDAKCPQIRGEGQYVLVTLPPDLDETARWSLISRSRSRKCKPNHPGSAMLCTPNADRPVFRDPPNKAHHW